MSFTIFQDVLGLASQLVAMIESRRACIYYSYYDTMGSDLRQTHALYGGWVGLGPVCARLRG
jgi:hypothetical protein